MEAPKCSLHKEPQKSKGYPEGSSDTKSFDIFKLCRVLRNTVSVKCDKMGGIVILTRCGLEMGRPEL